MANQNGKISVFSTEETEEWRKENPPAKTKANGKTPAVNNLKTAWKAYQTVTFILNELGLYDPLDLRRLGIDRDSPTLEKRGKETEAELGERVLQLIKGKEYDIVGLEILTYDLQDKNVVSEFKNIFAYALEQYKIRYKTNKRGEDGHLS
jgi:hypothetical protein